MADEKPETNPWEPVILLFGLFFALLALLWARGGLSQMNAQSFFVASPLTSSTTPEASTSTDAVNLPQIPSY